MDACRVRACRAVIAQKADRLKDTERLPLGLSEKKNGVVVVCKPRMREVSFQCKSSTASPSRHAARQRSPSPVFSYKSNAQEMQLPKRAQSADRRQPAKTLSACSWPSTPACDSTTEMHTTHRHFLSGKTPDGLWPSMRSLSQSLVMDSTSIPAVKKEVVESVFFTDRILKSTGNAVSERKRTPLRRNSSDLSENARPMEDLRARVVDPQRSGLRDRKVSGCSSLNTDVDRKAMKSISLPSPSQGILPRRVSNSHGSVKGCQQLKYQAEKQVSLHCSGQLKHESCLSTISTSCLSKRALPVTKPSRMQPSPVPRSNQALLLNKTISAPSSAFKEMNSPSLLRPSSPFSASNCTTSGAASPPSVLNCIVQMRKGKKSPKQIEDTHQVRLLYNRYLQWRFVNALADDALSVQKIRAESTLYNMGNVTSELYDPVIREKIYVQHLKQETKLIILLKEQMAYLEEWAVVESEHCGSLLGTIRALKANTLQIPVTGGAKVDVRTVKNAINSAVDAMQAIGSSICYLLSKVEWVSTLVSNLLTAARKERVILDDCAELLALAGVLQVQESSLRGHMMQLGHDPYKH